MRDDAFTQAKVDVLVHKMLGVFSPKGAPAIENHYIGFDFRDFRDPVAIHQIKMVTEIYHQLLINNDFDFADSHIRVRADSFGGLSFRFTTPEMGQHFIENLGPIFTAILAQTYRQMPDKEFEDMFVERFLGLKPDFTPPEAPPRPANGRVREDKHEHGRP